MLGLASKKPISFNVVEIMSMIFQNTKKPIGFAMMFKG